MEPEQFLWVEKYRPRTIEQCILPQDIKDQFESLYPRVKFIPNSIISGKLSFPLKLPLHFSLNSYSCLAVQL